MTRIVIHIFQILICLTIEINAQQMPLTDLLPQPPEGWNIARDKMIYTPETLYDYIDGGAELYISYNFREVASIIFSKKGVGEIRVEIFDMSLPKNAFGVFSHTRTTNENKYGQGSQHFTGAEIFWKDKYYISVVANDENEEIAKAIAGLSVIIDSQIQSTGKIPEIIDLLPQTGLVNDDFCYFHHYIWMNSFYFISTDNILNINDSTDAVIAKYGPKERRYYLLIVKYISQDEAMAAYSGFANSFSITNDDSIIKIEDGTWMGTGLQGNVFYSVFNAGNYEDAGSLLDAVKQKLK